MLKDEDIICISSIDWDFIWQGHQEIMTRFARGGNRVFFIENTGVRAPTLKDLPRLKNRLRNWRKGIGGIRKIEDNLYVYSPLVLPFPYSRTARFLNKRIILAAVSKWLRAMRVKSPLIWTFLPTGLVLDIMKGMDYKLLVYYCIDSFVSSSSGAGKIRHTEDLVIEKADLVFVTSMELQRRCSRHNGNVYNFPFGVNLENFESVRKDTHTRPPIDLPAGKGRIVGYVGGLHKWVDFDLLAFLARKNSGDSFVLVGPPQADAAKIKGIGNIYTLGQKAASEVPLYIKYFDVCLVPYLITDYTRNVYPTKLNEYLGMGKFVVSTALPEVLEFNRTHNGVVLVGYDKEDFNMKLQGALEQAGKDPQGSKARIRESEKNSWTSKIEDMSSAVEKAAAIKNKNTQKDWSGNLRRIYRSTKKSVVKAALVAVLLYLAIFQTGAGWYIGKPLAISDKPEKSDCVIVLGGGVGESGKAGQGYEERVSKAVELYKKGYAGSIVYSTGYAYMLKEAYVMAVLSESMGVKKSDIIIEDRSVNTHDNIVNTAKIMKERGWNSAIIVSSKYHMMRVRLVCDKLMPDVRVLFVPTESSYYSGNRITLRHLE
ncbi:MAG: ElyC/SanA/YdcF family protein, partial [Candidatus Omnitrophica bacterium]|nr:ElyC/SanA/YdcF family protein [Candidatus Omnitrophota bacterium]